MLCSALDTEVRSVSKVIWDSLSLSTNLSIDLLKLHGTPQNSLLQPTWEGSSVAGVVSYTVLLAVNHPAVLQLRSPSLHLNTSTRTAVEIEMPHSKNLNSFFHKSCTSLEIVWSSLILLSLSCTSLSVSPVCLWQPDFMRTSKSPSNT